VQSSSKSVFFDDYVFQVWNEVYEPAEDSFLFAENLPTREVGQAIDVGTGCGILGIIIARRAKMVIATDINPYAVRCARQNARANGVSDRMHFFQGDLFSPLRVGERFDLVLFNAPYLPSKQGEGSSWVERAWTGGDAGRRAIDDFVRKATLRLRPGGEILLMQSNLSDVEETLSSFKGRGLTARIVARQDMPFFETIFLVGARLH
jgi:release factor glutamine methyltransferase